MRTFESTHPWITFDVNALLDMGLIQREGYKVRARRELILSFLPLRSEK